MKNNRTWPDDIGGYRHDDIHLTFDPILWAILHLCLVRSVCISRTQSPKRIPCLISILKSDSTGTSWEMTQRLKLEGSGARWKDSGFTRSRLGVQNVNAWFSRCIQAKRRRNGRNTRFIDHFVTSAAVWHHQMFTTAHLAAVEREPWKSKGGRSQTWSSFQTGAQGCARVHEWLCIHVCCYCLTLSSREPRWRHGTGSDSEGIYFERCLCGSQTHDKMGETLRNWYHRLHPPCALHHIQSGMSHPDARDIWGVSKMPKGAAVLGVTVMVGVSVNDHSELFSHRPSTDALLSL